MIEPFLVNEFQGQPGLAKRDRETWLLLITTAGKGELLSANKQFNVEPDHLICIKPHVNLSTTKTTSWHGLQVLFRPKTEWLPWLYWPEQINGLMLLPFPDEQHRDYLYQKLEEVRSYQLSDHLRSHALGVNLLEHVILMCDQMHYAAQRVIDPRIQRALLEIQLRLHQPLPVSELARLATLSPSRFAYLFRSQLGISPQQYIEQERMRQATKSLLESERQIQDIARDVGFEDPFYFSTRFARHFGCSPKSWRENQRKQAENN